MMVSGKLLVLANDHSAGGHLKMRFQAITPDRCEVMALDVPLVREPVPTADIKALMRQRRELYAVSPEQFGRNVFATEASLDLEHIQRSWDSAAKVEFWVDPDPNSQITLMLFLAFLAKEGLGFEKVFLRHGSIRWGEVAHDNPEIILPDAVQVTQDHVTVATSVWSAFSASSPIQWVKLLEQDLSSFPFLLQTTRAMLQDLPDARTGLGEAERLILSSIGSSGSTVMQVMATTFEANPGFLDTFQIEGLFNKLAGGSAPLISGLSGKLTQFTDYEDHDNWKMYHDSRLELSPLAHRIITGEQDLVAQHGINRWWGGTHLTSAACWRWDMEQHRLLEP